MEVKMEKERAHVEIRARMNADDEMSEKAAASSTLSHIPFFQP